MKQLCSSACGRYPVLKHPRRFSGLAHYGMTPAELRAGHLPQA